MPSKSKQQRQLMGYAYAIKKAGKKSKKYKEASQSVKDLADSMSLDKLKDFASTKEKGLPNKVKKKKKNESYQTKHIKLFEYYDNKTINVDVQVNENFNNIMNLDTYINKHDYKNNTKL